MTRPLTFASPATLTLEQYAAAATAAFSGYQIPVVLDSPTLARRIRIEQHDLHQSLVAYDGDEFAGFAILAIRGDKGWVGGFAIMPAQRGKGRGGELMSALVERARACALRELSLEVLVDNTSAFRLYKNAGMHVTRDLLVMERAEISGANDAVEGQLKEAASEKLLAHFARLHVAPPQWSRDLPSLLTTDGLRGLYLGDEHKPDAYMLLASRPTGTYVGDLAAADPSNAHALCEALQHISEPLKIVNEPDNGIFTEALFATGWVETGRQHEMMMRL